MTDNRSPLASLLAQAEKVKGKSKRFDERDLAGGAPAASRARRATRGKVRVQFELSPAVAEAVDAIARQVGTSPASVAEWLMRCAIELGTVGDLAAALVPSRAPNYALWHAPAELDQSALQRFGLNNGAGIENAKMGAENRTLLNPAPPVSAATIGGDNGGDRRRR